MVKKGYIAPNTLHTFYGRHYELVNRYDISISQNAMDLFPLYRFVRPSITVYRTV